MKNLNEEQFYIWLAGFIDGEGCIYVDKSRCIGNSWGFQYGLRLEITQANEPLLNQIKERIGFGSNVRNKSIERTIGRKSTKIVYALKLSGNNAYGVLKNVYPYLVVKREQASLGMEFQELIQRNYSKRKNREKNYPEKQIALREALMFAKRKPIAP